jgi:hypothetical protein
MSVEFARRLPAPKALRHNGINATVAVKSAWQSGDEPGPIVHADLRLTGVVSTDAAGVEARPLASCWLCCLCLQTASPTTDKHEQKMRRSGRKSMVRFRRAADK